MCVIGFSIRTVRAAVVFSTFSTFSQTDSIGIARRARVVRTGKKQPITRARRRFLPGAATVGSTTSVVSTSHENRRRRRAVRDVPFFL